MRTGFLEIEILAKDGEKVIRNILYRVPLRTGFLAKQENCHETGRPGEWYLFLAPNVDKSTDCYKTICKIVSKTKTRFSPLDIKIINPESDLSKFIIERSFSDKCRFIHDYKSDFDEFYSYPTKLFQSLIKAAIRQFRRLEK